MIKKQSDKFQMAINHFFVFINHLNSKLKTNKPKLGSSTFILKAIEVIPYKIPSSEPTTINYIKIHSKIWNSII